MVPNTDPNADWTFIYTANCGAIGGGKALGYAGGSIPQVLRLVIVPTMTQWEMTIFIIFAGLGSF